MELIDVTTKQVFDAVHKLNSRPRKCLGFKTPYEVFEKLTGIKEKNVNRLCTYYLNLGLIIESGSAFIIYGE